MTKTEDQLARWRDHFKQILNRPQPVDPPELAEGPTLNIRTNAITNAEDIKDIKNLKNGKADGVDKIPPEAIKCLIQQSIFYTNF